MHEQQTKSLSEVHASVDTEKKGFFRKLLAFLGPAYLISVGYMDPGNWATDIAAGSRYGYALIWVLLLSNLMAILLQSLSARLGLVSGRDLAQASRETYGRSVNFILYLMAEIAIAATDLAEILGMAIGLQLLFGLPLIYGVLLTFLDTFLLLFFIHRGMRVMEAFILVLISIIGIGFLIEVIMAKPDPGPLVAGFIPHIPDASALYIMIGIIGATVMPHNLYLHSSLVQSRKYGKSLSDLQAAIRFNFMDSVIALNLAFLVNAAILILAAATFYRAGMYDVAEIQDAHRFLQPLLGSKVAPIIFAVALIAAGQSSTLTGTLAGQIVMEGYLHLRIQPWVRRLITRSLAIIPAVLVISIAGEQMSGELLILSQVILSLQLGFAVIPLIHFVSDRKRMGKLAIGPLLKILSWLVAGIIVVLNGKLVFDTIGEWLKTASSPLLLWLTLVPITVLLSGLLLYITIKPWIQSIFTEARSSLHYEQGELAIFQKKSFQRIAVAVDFSPVDEESLRFALSLGQSQSQFLLIHVVESPGAMLLGKEIRDKETEDDAERLDQYVQTFLDKGYSAEGHLGFGSPKSSIPRAVENFNADLLVLGAHGHRFFKDLIFGTTVDAVRHKVNIPVLIVRETSKKNKY